MPVHAAMGVGENAPTRGGSERVRAEGAFPARGASERTTGYPGAGANGSRRGRQ